MMKLHGLVITSASFAVYLLMSAPEVSSSGDQVATSCFNDGYGFNYSLPMRPCKEIKVSNQTGSRMVQMIPKLIPPSRYMEKACGRESRIGIPRGHRICRVPDCGSNPCISGWCEETMTSYECRCPPGITGRNCDKEEALEKTTSTTIRTSTGVPRQTPITTSTPTAAPPSSSNPTTRTTTDILSSPDSTCPTSIVPWSQQIRPLAFFKFENDLTDSSEFASDSDVSLSGSLTYDNGICGQAAVFDGSTKVTVRSFEGYAWGMNFSVSVWFKRTGQRNTWQGIVNNGDNLRGSWKITVSGPENGGTARPCLTTTDTPITCADYGIRTGADWNHIVMTFDGNQKIDYLNGHNMRLTETCCNREIVTKPTPMSIGHIGTDITMKFFYGLIDEVRIYNHTLSASQVRDLYNASRCT